MHLVDVSGQFCKRNQGWILSWFSSNCSFTLWFLTILIVLFLFFASSLCQWFSFFYFSWWLRFVQWNLVVSFVRWINVKWLNCLILNLGGLIGNSHATLQRFHSSTILFLISLNHWFLYSTSARDFLISLVSFILTLNVHVSRAILIQLSIWNNWRLSLFRFLNLLRLTLQSLLLIVQDDSRKFIVEFWKFSFIFLLNLLILVKLHFFVASLLFVQVNGYII